MVGVKSNIFFYKGQFKNPEAQINTHTTPLKKEFFHNVNSRSKGWILSYLPKVSFDKPFFQK